jgi:small conductance mechanosensitive channel
METLNQVLQDLLTHFVLFLPKLVVSLVVFAVTLIAAGTLGRTVRRVLERRKASYELTLLISRLVRWTIIVLGSVVALQQVDFDVAAFLTGLGILGFTVGFALQGISQNFVAGILLLLQQPFDIGDVIQVGEFLGEVVTIELRTTKLRMLDGKTVLIPNADVLTSSVVNYSDGSQRRIEVAAGVSYDSDLDLVRQTTVNVINDIAGVLQDPAPEVVFNNLGPSTVDFTVYYWIDTEQTSVVQAKDAGVRTIKTTFEQASIEMPYPTQTVVLRQE